MGNNLRTNQLIRNLIILSDFVVLNVIYSLYIYFNPVPLNHSNAMLLILLSNFGFLVAQYYYSTVVHEPLVSSDKVLRQVTRLAFLQQIVSFLMIKTVFMLMDITSPLVRFYLYLAPIFYLGLLGSRYSEKQLIKYIRRMGHNVRYVLFVGNSLSLLSIRDYLTNDPSHGYRILGYYSDHEMEERSSSMSYLGTIDDAISLLNEQREHVQADELYCCLPSSQDETIMKVMRACNNSMVRFFYVPLFATTFGHSLRLERLGEHVVMTNCEEPLNQPVNKLFKRTFDVLFSLIVLICMLPFLPIIAIIIKLQSPGPIFFKQKRTGLNGADFYCYKFRSMHINAEADKLQCTENDPRKFAFGNLMRKTNIDELPQFFNVLRGDMSVVGPRPHMLYHTEVYRKLIDKYMIRHFVKPGITGWAQVTGFRGETKELWQMEGRVERDIWYIENWSIWLDIRIIWRTIKQILVRDKKAY